MPSLNQVVFNFLNPASGGRATRDRVFSRRQVAYIANVCRAFLLYADVKKDYEASVLYEQDLGCVNLETVDQADCPQREWGDDVKKVQLPPIIKLDNNGGLTFFGLIDKRTRIYVPSVQYGSLDEHVPFKKKSSITGEMIGNTIYAWGAKSENLCAVNIRGIFSDPTLVNTFGATGFTPRCFDWDTDNYPIPAHLEQAMYDMMNEKYLNILAKAPEDIQNDEKKEALV